MRLRKQILSLAAAGILSLLMPVAALAAEVQTGNTVTVGPNQVVNDDLYAFGSNVVVQGTVHGDVLTAGSTVTISGHVTGSVMAAGSLVTISGPVDGNVRIAGNVLTLDAPVAGDALMAGSTMTINPAAHIGRDALLAGAIMEVSGPVARNVDASGNRLTIASNVGGRVKAEVQNLVLGDGASVSGPVTYVSSHDATVAPTATLGGVLQRTAPITTANPWEVAGIDTLALLRGFVGLAVLGLLLVFAFPRAANATVTTMHRRWVASILLGCGLLFGTPMVALATFLLGLLVGGWWIGLLLLLLYAVLAVTGYLATAQWLGATALRSAERAEHAVWAMLLGLLVLAVLSVIPFIGGLVVFAAIVFGVGGLTLAASQAYRRVPPVAVAPSVQPAPTPLQAVA